MNELGEGGAEEAGVYKVAGNAGVKEEGAGVVAGAGKAAEVAGIDSEGIV